MVISVCQSCLPNNQVKLIKCKICDLESKQDFKKFLVSETSQQAFNMCIGDIFQILVKETTERLNELKGFYFYLIFWVISINDLFLFDYFLDQLKIKDETLGAAFDYVKDEIDVKVESVKIQVEEVGNKVKEKIDKLRNEFFK